MAMFPDLTVLWPYESHCRAFRDEIRRRQSENENDSTKNNSNLLMNIPFAFSFCKERPARA